MSAVVRESRCEVGGRYRGPGLNLRQVRIFSCWAERANLISPSSSSPLLPLLPLLLTTAETSSSPNILTPIPEPELRLFLS